MKIAICDDCQKDLEEIAALLHRYDPTLSCQLFSSASELLASDQENNFDLILLDIEMPSPNGYEIAQQLKKRETPPIVIFVSNYTEYSVQGYEVAFRYLVKPVSMQKFSQVMDAARSELVPKSLTFSKGGATTIISISEIAYIEAANNDLIIHTDKDDFTFRGYLKDIRDKLPPGSFSCPHSSYLIHLSHIRSLAPNEVVMVNGGHIPISRNRKAEFKDEVFSYLRR